MNAPLHLVVRRPAAAGSDGLAAELSLHVPSNLEYVGEAVELVAHHCRTGALSHRRIQFNLRTALAEALANAILYGNRQDPAKLVHVRVELGREGVRIQVTDDGAGFDPSSVPDPTTAENLEREEGRGLFVLRHLVDHVTFNEKGNCVCLTLRAG